MTTDLQRLVECSVCMGTFRDPRVLFCGHSFCFLCLKQIALREDCFRCPQCRKDQVGFTSVENLPKNLDMSRLVENLERITMTPTQETSEEHRLCLCGQCNQRHAVDKLIYCTLHSKYVCSTCLTTHEDCSTIKAFTYGVDKLVSTREKLEALKKSFADLGCSQLQLDILYYSIFQAKLRAIFSAATDRFEAAAGRCRSFEVFISNVLKNPHEAAVVAAEGLIDFDKTVNSLTNELEVLRKSVDYVHSLVKDHYIVKESKFIISEIVIKSRLMEQDFYTENREAIIALINAALKKCNSVDEIPRTIVAEFKWVYGTFTWYAWMHEGGNVSWAHVSGKLDSGVQFGLFLHKHIHPVTMDEEKALEFLKEKIVEHKSEENPSLKIDHEADATLGPYWLCLHGKPGSVVTACSDGTQHVVKWTEGDVEYALLKHYVNT